MPNFKLWLILFIEIKKKIKIVYFPAIVSCGQKPEFHSVHAKSRLRVSCRQNHSFTMSSASIYQCFFCFADIKVITRINYGQSVRISGLAGAVSLAGSESGLWSVKGGNWQLAAGLLKISNATLHLQEGIDSITDAGDYYVLKSNTGNEYNCTVTVVATPLDEVNITFSPPITIPQRKMQHTHTTFVRGFLNHVSAGVQAIIVINRN